MDIRIFQPRPCGSSGQPLVGEQIKRFSDEFPGFDPADAMNRLNGDLDLFKELIHQFYEDNKDMVSLITGMLTDKAALKSEIHRLKGTCATLSAPDLHRALEHLEAVVNQNESDLSPPHQEISSSMETIKKEMARIKKTVHSLLSSPNRDPEASISDVPENIPERLKALGELIEQNSLSAKALSKNLAADLFGTPLFPQASQLENQIKRFEFTKARQTFGELSSALAIVRGD